MLWSMNISNSYAQFRLARKEFMQNDTIYEPLSRGNMVLTPIGINFVKVVCGCQSNYVFIFCGQRPWRPQTHNLVDIKITALLSRKQQSCQKIRGGGVTPVEASGDGITINQQ